MSDVDIAIVGGGVSGLYAAWRLSTRPNPPKVAVFESSPRLGGRIDTASLPVPTVAAKAEFGAMRFLPSMQMVSTLLNYFSIPREPFPGVDLQQTFLRGIQVNPDCSNLPYHLAPGESTNVGTLLVTVLNGGVPNATGLNSEQWREVTRKGTFKGSDLWRWGVENVASEFISNEAYEYLTDAAGLDSTLLRANAANGIRCVACLLPDLATKQVFRPVEGFCSLITTLVNRIGICPKCHIHESHRVVSVERAADALRLNFEPAPGPSTIAVQQVTADKVIFALPRRALELIEFGGVFPERVPQGRTAFLGKLAGVNGIPAFKLCVVYDQPWWQAYQDVNLVQRGWNDGYAVTDLPLRQVFFGLGVGSTPADNQRVLLASYADTQAAQYWTGQAQVSDSQTMLGSNSKFRQADPGNLTEAINRQLSQLLQINGPLPEPLAVGYMDWSADPFGGGWHEWNPGVDIMTAIPDMRHPIADAPIYVCGEAYSWYQSWIEGALMSAERMLQDHFQLSWPVEWLPTNYDLGP